MDGTLKEVQNDSPNSTNIEMKSSSHWYVTALLH